MVNKTEELEKILGELAERKSKYDEISSRASVVIEELQDKIMTALRGSHTLPRTADLSIITQTFSQLLKTKLDAEDMNVPKSNSTIKERKNTALTEQENTKKIQKYLDLLNKANKDINNLQKKNKELQFKLEDKQVQEELSGFRTEEANFSNYEEEFDLRKMVNGTKEKNRSEDINIDYPGMQGVKDRNKELKQKMNMLIEQVKILIANVNINSKIKPQINQICQLMRIPAQNIQMIISGKNKKKALGLFE